MTSPWIIYFFSHVKNKLSFNQNCIKHGKLIQTVFNIPISLIVEVKWIYF